MRFPPTEYAAAPGSAVFFETLTVRPDRVDAPGFFVDRNLTITWMASGGTDPLSIALARELRDRSSRNVFDLLLRPHVKTAVSDWRSFFAFVYANLCQPPSRESIPIASSFLPRKKDVSSSCVAPAGNAHRAFVVDSCLIDSDVQALRIFSMAFKEGTLFVLRPDCWMQASDEPDPATLAAPTPSPSGKHAICVLSARLNDARRLSRQMLPERFVRLMDRIGAESGDIIRSLGGRRFRCNGPQLCYAFSQSAGRDPVFSAVCAASRLNSQMILLEEKLHARYGWTNEIRLATGIGYGEDFHPVSENQASLAFVIPGGAFEQARLASTVAGKAEIWITKQAASQLPGDLIDRVVFGIERQGIFLRHFFRRLSDFSQLKPVLEEDPDALDLSIAQIRALERHIAEPLMIRED